MCFNLFQREERGGCFMSVGKDHPKKLFIKTWGCQMNAYDSTRMADVLAPLGYCTTEGPEDADMVILNTCHIREKAADKLFSELGRLRAHKEARRTAGSAQILAVAGCVAQAEGAVILERAPYVDLVFGPQTYHTLPEMVAQVTGAYGAARLVNTDFPAEPKFDRLPEENRSQGPSAFLSVQEGCDKFCTFCVVPYTRGAEYSRPAAAILEEARRLTGAGALEITLLGQNVNAWHGQGRCGQSWGLGRLIAALAEIPGLARIRYTTSHPMDMDQELIAAHRDIPLLMPFLHLPVQSGSDAILKAMNRKHDADHYLRIVDAVRSARPDIALSSDFIVGFPGETEKDFEATLALIERVGFASAYSFAYSARPGTPAAVMGGLVPERVKAERLQRLQSLLFSQQERFNRRSIGQTVPVLFDRKGREAGQLHGRTPWNQALHTHGPDRFHGTIQQVRVTGGHQNSLTGSVVAAGEETPLPKTASS